MFFSFLYLLCIFNIFNKDDSFKIIYVFIHMKHTFNKFHSQMCGKYLKKNIESETTLKKKTIVLGSSERYQYFRHSLLNPKVP